MYSHLRLRQNYISPAANSTLWSSQAARGNVQGEEAFSCYLWFAVKVEMHMHLSTQLKFSFKLETVLIPFTQ